MTLLERNLRLLERTGVRRAHILTFPADPPPPLSIPRPLSLERHEVSLAFCLEDPLRALGEPELGLEGCFFSTLR